MAAQPRRHFVIVDPHAEIRLQRAEAEIEQDRFAIFRLQRFTVGIEFGQHDAPVHRAIVGRQAKRNPLAPACPGDALGRNGRQSRKFDGDAAARGNGRSARCRLRQVDLLIAVARKFGDAAERAEAPLRIGIGDLLVQQIDGRASVMGIERSASPGISPGEYRLGDQDKPARRRPACRSERRAGLQHEGPARQRIGTECAGVNALAMA